MFTFRGGIHPRYNKDISIREPLREAPLPDEVVIPLSQHIGAPNRSVVSKGDEVEEGAIIGRTEAFISCPVHSPVPGKVKDVKKAFHPALGPMDAVIIERDKEKPARKYTENDIENYSSREIIEKVRDAGIVGLGGAAFPTHVKLSVPEGKTVDTLLINGAECEPYLTCDHVLMTRRAEEVLKGIEIMVRVLNPQKTFIAIEDNKKAALFAFQKLIKKSTNPNIANIKLAQLKTKYPQGGEKQLISAISGKEVPPGKLPLDIGFIVQNVGTAYAVYEAVYLDKPLMERVVTLSGDCLNRPGNYVIRTGMTIGDIVEKCGIKLEQDPVKVIMGGPMMGFTQPTLDTPVLKSTSGILFLSEKVAGEQEENPCIKCAKCVDVCPVNLVPTDIMKNVKHRVMDRMEGLRVSDCMECGSCTYTCPAGIPLVQYIKEGKAEVLRKKRHE
ncbi:MAG: electron transport complex subunit RsxC [Candidatus Omnitrophica bacterium]|nr:electron transport complex subunit RsxC [Candidatus Omnitrophota bacterium]